MAKRRVAPEVALRKAALAWAEGLSAPVRDSKDRASKGRDRKLQRAAMEYAKHARLQHTLPLRERLVHALAIQPMKADELFQWLGGVSDYPVNDLDVREAIWQCLSDRTLLLTTDRYLVVRGARYLR